MKFLVLLLLVQLSFLYAQSNTSALIPYPNHIELAEKGEGYFSLSEKVSIVHNLPSHSICLQELEKIVKQHTGIQLRDNKEATRIIELLIDPSIQGEEGYILHVTQQKISLKGRSNTGVLYALMSLDQILLGDVLHTAQKRIEAVRIEDSPRFAFRALMLDPARHFLPVEDVKFYIREMARYKYNTLQLHLTDDQGWRMEIKSHPGLTELGARRNPNAAAAQGMDNGFYTQEELKSLVAYAAQYGIDIIPEIDVPGHTAALLAVYPHLACSHRQNEKINIGKSVNVMLCASNKDASKVLADIIKEVAEIFPSPYIHLGGDESHIESNWAKCEKCQSLMKEKSYTKPAQLMNDFFAPLFASVREHKKRAMLWCELDSAYMPAHEYLFDYPKDVVLITWRNGLTPKCIELTQKSQHSLIMAPGEYCYFDYPQHPGDLPEFNNWGMPVTSLEKCYQLDPAYALGEKEQAHIMGVNGTLWGEAIQNIDRAMYMTYPRALALSEAGWTEMKHRNWDSFKQRLYPNVLSLIKRGVFVRAPFELKKR